MEADRAGPQCHCNAVSESKPSHCSSEGDHRPLTISPQENDNQPPSPIHAMSVCVGSCSRARQAARR